MAKKTVQKMVTFPEPLYEVTDEMANEWGVSFSRYLQMLAFTAAEEWAAKRKKIIPMVDEETENAIGESLEALDRGEYVDIDSEDKLKKFLRME